MVAIGKTRFLKAILAAEMLETIGKEFLLTTV